jgi:hypothetical protein
MAIDVAVQRLQIGDVILIALPEHASKVEATVVRPIDRTERSVRVDLRVQGSEVQGSEDFVKEWPLDEMVTVVRGP